MEASSAPTTRAPPAPGGRAAFLRHGLGGNSSWGLRKRRLPRRMRAAALRASGLALRNSANAQKLRIPSVSLAASVYRAAPDRFGALPARRADGVCDSFTPSVAATAFPRACGNVGIARRPRAWVLELLCGVGKVAWTGRTDSPPMCRARRLRPAGLCSSKPPRTSRGPG